MKRIETKKPKRKFWKTADGILQEFLKNTLWELLTFIVKIVWNWYGMSILLLLTTSSLFLLNLLTIRIPLYIPIVIFLMIIFVLFISQRIRKLLLEKSRSIKHYDLLWRIRKGNIILGPFCPKCEETIDYKYNQYTSATNAIFGKDPEYLFTCICGYQVILNKSSSAIKLDIRKTYLKLDG